MRVGNGSMVDVIAVVLDLNNCYLVPALSMNIISGSCLMHYQKKTHPDILGRTKKNCHTYDTSMTIIVTKPGIIIDVVGSYFYDKKS